MRCSKCKNRKAAPFMYGLCLKCANDSISSTMTFPIDPASKGWWKPTVGLAPCQDPVEAMRRVINKYRRGGK